MITRRAKAIYSPIGNYVNILFVANANRQIHDTPTTTASDYHRPRPKTLSTDNAQTRLIKCDLLVNFASKIARTKKKA